MRLWPRRTQRRDSTQGLARSLEPLSPWHVLLSPPSAMAQDAFRLPSQDCESEYRAQLGVTKVPRRRKRLLTPEASPSQVNADLWLAKLSVERTTRSRSSLALTASSNELCKIPSRKSFVPYRVEGRNLIVCESRLASWRSTTVASQK